MSVLLAFVLGPAAEREGTRVIQVLGRQVLEVKVVELCAYSTSAYVDIRSSGGIPCE